MRYLTIILVSTVLLGRTVAIAAPPAPVPGGPALQECTSADLSIVGKNHGKDFLFKLRDDLEIKLTGPCVRALMDASTWRGSEAVIGGSSNEWARCLHDAF